MDEFVTKLIVNVIMLNRLDKNANKLLLLDLGVNNFLLNEKVCNCFLNENVSNFDFGPKCQYVFIGQKYQ